MNLCFVLLYLLMIASSLLADDATAPTRKKEKIQSLPHFWISEGLLYLKAQERGVAVANHPQGVASGVQFADSHTLSPDFKWNFGVKIDLGYQPKKLFYFASWSAIQNTAHAEKYTSGATGFFPIQSLDKTLSPTDYVTSGNLHWKLNTNLVDGGVIFSYRPVKFFILKSRLGVRIASLYQKFSVNYGGGVFSRGIDHLTMRNNFLGIGPMVAIAPNFVLKNGFSLIGDCAVSPLIGRFYLKQKERYLRHTLFRDTDIDARLRWALDAKVAIAWQKEFLYKALVFCAELGWEWHEFYSQKQLHQNAFNFFGSNDNLILRGGSLMFCLGF